MKTAKPAKTPAPEVREALEDLLEEGLLVSISEAHPSTGRLRKLYYHRDHVPKPE
jgi:predicted ArsR family transcriptional regulator